MSSIIQIIDIIINIILDMVFQFSIMMMIAFSIQIAVGLFVVESSDQLDEIVEKGLNETLNGIKNDEKLYVPWDLLQNNVKRIISNRMVKYLTHELFHVARVLWCE